MIKYPAKPDLLIYIMMDVLIKNGLENNKKQWCAYTQCSPSKIADPKGKPNRDYLFKEDA